MSKYLYGISKQKARENFDRYLTNSYSDFLSKRDCLDLNDYELYIDPIYDEESCEKVGCNYICYFDGKREEFSDISEAEAYSADYFLGYCVSLACNSFDVLRRNLIFNDFSFSVYDSFCSFDEVFSTNRIEDIFDWLKAVPGHVLNFHFYFSTPYDYADSFFLDECKWMPMHSVFRHYLVNEEGLNLVDLFDFDFFFDFLRLQEKLTCYEVRLSTFTGYNTFLVHVYHKKE